MDMRGKERARAGRPNTRLHGRRSLRAMLEEGAIRRADRDRRLAQDWFPLEQEAAERTEQDS